MSVFKPAGRDYYRYDFIFKGRRYTSSTGLSDPADAEAFEAQLKRTLRRRAAGLEAEGAKDTPRFSDWAAVTLKWQATRKGIKRADAAENTLRMILAFWGAKPRRAEPVEGGVYRDLRLGHPIERPELIGEFEDWMTTRKLSGSRKNHYRSACSMLYRVALLPENRRRSGVRENPFAHVLRDRVRRRTAVPEVDQIVTWLETAPVPVAIGVGLALLSPALRLGNVVELRRDQVARDLSVLTVPHKTDRETGLPLSIAISPGLRRVLARVYEQYPKDRFIVPLPAMRRRLEGGSKKGDRYWQFFRLVKTSIKAAGLPYGRRHQNGITFHTLRHAVQTWLARWKVSKAHRQRALAHETSAMTDWYEHLGGADMGPTMNLIDRRLPVAAVLEKRLIERASPVQSPIQAKDSVGPNPCKLLKTW
jgi:integrase